jgi:hypothetical protein
MKTTAIIVVTSIFSLVGTLSAEEKSKPKRPHKLPPEIMEKFDKDGDGKLNKEEKIAMREERNKKALEHFDQDRDGKLSDEEKAKMKEAMRKLHGKLGKDQEAPGAGL